MLRLRRLARWCMWLMSLAFLMNVGMCVTSDYVKLDWIAKPGWRLYVGQGYICWLGYDGGYAPALQLRGAEYSIGIGDGPSWWGVDVFGVEYVEISFNMLGLGYALLAALAGGTILLVQWRLANRGLCIRCAYDLTGNVSGVCSECGHVVSAPTTRLRSEVH